MLMAIENRQKTISSCLYVVLNKEDVDTKIMKV